MRVLLSQGLVSISKPRCASTTLRRMLDPLVLPEKGDIRVDVAGQKPPFHPHITAPYLSKVLAERGIDPAGLTFLIVVRHPVEMLWSYYKFFKPDAESRYSFSPGWAGASGIGFEEWVLRGHVGINPDWAACAPGWITPRDLSPLSLEAHIEDAEGRSHVQEIFQVEDLDRLSAWLEARVGRPMPQLHVNGSTEDPTPPLGTAALDRIRATFPTEARMYGI